MILKDKSNKNNHKKVLSIGIEHAHTKPTTSCRLKNENHFSAYTN